MRKITEGRAHLGRTAAVAAAVVACLALAAGPATAATKPITVCKSGTDVIQHDQTWSATAAPSYLIGCVVEIAKGATLTIEKRTVVKFGLGGVSGEIYVAPGGRLYAEGCPQPPHIPGHPWHSVPCPKQRIFFTTVYDNTVGGSTAPAGDAGSTWEYPQVVAMDGQSSVLIDYAEVRHAANSVVAADPEQIAGCAAHDGASLSFTSTFTVAPVSMGQCASSSSVSHYHVSGDTFFLPAGTTGVSLGGYPSDTAVVSADHFYYGGSSPTVAIQTNSLPVQGIALSGRSSSTFSTGTPTTVNLVNGTVPAGTSWGVAPPDGATVEGQVAVAGKALVSAGAVLDGMTLTVDPKGQLAALGTATRPVKFEQGSQIQLTGSGALTVDHAAFGAGLFGNSLISPIDEPGGAGCQAQGGESVSIENSYFPAPVGIGGCDSGGRDRFVIQHNYFAVPDDYTALSVRVPELNFSAPGNPGQLTVASNDFVPAALKLSQAGPPEVDIYGWPVQGIALTGPTVNHFRGTGNGRVLDLTATVVPLGAAWTVGPGAGATLEVQTEYVFGNPGLAVKGKLVLDPGTIVKVGQGAGQAGGFGVGYGIGLANIGTLVANGRSGDPIIVTSMNDDSVGGRSNGVPSVASEKDYMWAVSASEGSTVQASRTVFRDGQYAFQMQCSDTPEPGGGFDLTDSVIQAQVALGNCNGASLPDTPVLQRNHFSYYGAMNGSGNRQPAITLLNVDPTGVDLSGSASNILGGGGAGKVVALAGTEIANGRTWTVSGTSGAVLAASPDTDYLTRPGVTIDGTLALSDGVIVKSSVGGPALEVTKTGDVTIGGPASKPEVFTAFSDDSVGGDSNGDGSGSAPSPGAYGTAIQYDHISSVAPISDAVFKYAADALNYLYMSHDVAVSHSDFVDNQAAIAVEETSGPDYLGLGNLPCFPPWIFGVDARSDWFGPGGGPAPDIDLASVVGAVLPGDIPFEGTAFNYSGVGQMIDEEHLNFGKPNTVPWAIYSCAKVPLPIPLSAVEVFNTPGAPNYPGSEKRTVKGPGTRRRRPGSRSR